MEILKPYRERIDALDEKLVDLLVEREQIIREVAELKAAHDIPAVLPDRVDEVRERAVARAVEKGADENYIREIYKKIISLSCDLEEQRAQKEKRVS
jgi:chorismate mutase-like protein